MQNGCRGQALAELTLFLRRSILHIVLTRVRRLAALLLTLGLVAGMWRPCAGWEATAEARLSCCQRHAGCAKHKVTDHSVPVTQSDADACCAASERQDAAQPSVAMFAPPILVPAAALFTRPPIAPPPPVDWRPPPALTSRQLHTHVLLSVFLI
jgi:hypothetical protein